MWFLLAACVPFPHPAALTLAPLAPEPSPGVVFRLVVAGDAGVEPEDARAGTMGLLPALPAAMREAATGMDAEIVWLGDNVYEAGVGPRPKGIARARGILAAQVAAGPTPAQVSFVPGNHDYLQLAALRDRLGREADLIHDLGAHARAFGPPVERVPVAGTPFVRLYVDSERGIEDSAGARAEILAAVTGEEMAGHIPIVLGHHPAADVGPHGQPSLGAVIHTEMGHPQYRTYAADLVGALRGGDGLLVAGHEHAISLLRIDAVPGTVVQVVSGSAAKGRLGAPASDPRIDRRPGFVTLDLHADGAVDATPWFLQPDGAAGVGERCRPVTAAAPAAVCTPGTALASGSAP